MHLGPRVATLVDGQMSPAEEERAWAHVHACAACSAAVQREGWVKRRLAGLSYAGSEPLPDELKGALSEAAVFASYPAPDQEAVGRPRRLTGLAVLGAGSVGAAMMGVVALGAAPADAPAFDRRGPVTSITQAPGQAGGSTPGRRQGATTGGSTTTTLDLRDAGAMARRVAATLSSGMRMGL